MSAIAAVRPLARVRVFSPNRESRESFAAEMRERHRIDFPAVDAPEEVYRGAAGVSSCASAIGPVIGGSRLEPGTHVICIGGTLDAEANRRVDVALRFGLAPPPTEVPDLRVDAVSRTS